MSKIGIDFGTSYCSASRINNYGIPEAITFTGNGLKMPSLALFYQEPPLVGFEARSMYEEGLKGLAPEEQIKMISTLVKSIKTKLEPDAKLFGRTHEDIVSLILEKIKDEAERSCDPEKFTDLVLTHPVQFEEWKKELLVNSAHKAGFENIALLQEPVSAAIGYIRRENLRDIKGILVYDFGAGTLDTAYVMNLNGKFVVPLVPMGDSKCGGDDIDDALFQYLLDRAGHANAMKDMDLLWQCRRWKELLSSLESVPISYAVDGEYQSFTLTRNEFEAIAQPVINKTIALTSKLYEEIKDNGLPLDFILLIGGSSNIPLVGKLIKQKIANIDVRTSGINDIAVALGASYYSSADVQISAKTEPKLQTETDYCYCIYDGKPMPKQYKFCIHCGKPSYYYQLHNK